MAAERTFLAWVRTGLALMGFGFVVARFGLFLHELYLTGAARTGRLTQHSGYSAHLGVGLVLLGVAIDIVAAYRYLAVIKRLDAGHELRPPRWLGIGVATLLAAIGLGMVVYLLATAR